MDKIIIERFTKFRKKFNYQVLPLEFKDNCIFFNGELVHNKNTKKQFVEGENFINCSFGFWNNVGGALSNLFPMEFVFRGKKVSSIEGVLQGIKHKDIETQNLVFNYSGMNAYTTRYCENGEFWGKKGVLFWQGEEIKRDGEDYQIFLDELYLSVAQNLLYKKALLATGNKHLIHHIGKNDIFETVLTREEYEIRLNTMREFIKNN